MHAPFFEIVSVNPGVVAIFGSNPVRVYPFGLAPQNTTVTYAVFQQISGSPYNNISTRPNIDIYSIQVDVYAGTAKDVRLGAAALRDAIEIGNHGHVTSLRDGGKDVETDRYRYSLDIDFHVNRL